jgi:DNA-binding CsgD family transcriptional regulator
MAESLGPGCAPPPEGRRDFHYLKSWIAARSPEGSGARHPLREDVEQLFTHIFNKSKDGISIHALDFTIVGVNTTMQDWYAQGRPLVGRKCFEAYHGRTRRCDHCPFEAAVRTGRPQIGVVPYQLSGKSVGDQELSVFPLFDETRRLLCGLEYVRDITRVERDARVVETLKRRIQLQEHTLREQETALSVLLRQGPKLEQRIAEEIAESLDTLVMPLVARLKSRCAGSEAARDVAMLEQRLVEIASTDASRLTRTLRRLTAREREVATLVRQGRTSKEISEALRISAKGVDYHRVNIRKKLGLGRTSRSLRAELDDLEHPSPSLG